MTIVDTLRRSAPSPSNVATRFEGKPPETRTSRRWTGPALFRLISPLALLGVWFVGSATNLFPASKLPSPVLVAQTFGHLWSTGVLLPNIWASLVRVAIGLGLGVAVGTVLGLVAGIARFGEYAVDPIMQAFRTLPIFALLPLFVVWVGIGQASKVDMIAFASAFPIYINLFAGIRGIDPKLLETARSLGLSKVETLRHVMVPATMASFLVGLRLASATAWLVLVVVEQVNASSGIGFLVANAENYLQVNVIVVGLVIWAALGLATDSIVRFFERRLLVWR
jgi:sulfonate transport system permease protein